MSISQEDQAEIRAMRETTQPTRRATVAALEQVLFEPIPVLDHGFIRVIDYMGDDAAIVQAARVSYGAGTKSVRNDAGLIGYLMAHRHSTPFEMCELKVHVKLPIFVARQWIRHRTANVNEYSARYSILDREFYIPEADQLAVQSSSNRQGRGEALTADMAERVRQQIADHGAASYALYEALLGDEAESAEPGIARELARMVLPLNAYTQWYWKIDLHNLLHFIALRADAHAQYEIRAYAEILDDLVKRWVPLTHGAFQDHRRDGAAFSGPQLAVLKRMVAGESVDQAASGLSARGWRELQAVLGRD